MKKQPLIVILALLLIGGGYYGWRQWSGAGEEGALTLYGNVDIREVRLGFRVPGRLEAMLFEEGDRIAPGDLLARLDDRPARESLAEAEAAVMEARANRQRARSGSRPQEIQQAEAAVAEARAALQNAEKRLTRQRELFAQKLNSQSDLDDAEAQQEQAAARLRAAEEALALSREGFRQEDIAAAEAALARAEALRDQAQTRLDDTQLHAPSPGIVQVRVREPGAMLAVGEPVYVLTLTDTVYVRAYVDETRLALVTPGAAVTVSTDSTDRTWSGQVGFISPRAEFTPKTVETPELRTDLVYRLRIVVTDGDESLRQGMPVTIQLEAP